VWVNFEPVAIQANQLFSETAELRKSSRPSNAEWDMIDSFWSCSGTEAAASNTGNG